MIKTEGKESSKVFGLNWKNGIAFCKSEKYWRRSRFQVRRVGVKDLALPRYSLRLLLDIQVYLLIVYIIEQTGDVKLEVTGRQMLSSARVQDEVD